MENQLKRPAFGTFNHIALEVNNLQSALRFYQNILGLSELPMPEGVKESGISWLDLGNGIALHLVEKEDAAPGKTTHVAISIDDVEAWRQYLISKSIKIYPPKVDIYTAERFFFTDPSGNRLEFVKWFDR